MYYTCKRISSFYGTIYILCLINFSFRDNTFYNLNIKQKSFTAITIIFCVRQLICIINNIINPNQLFKKIFKISPSYNALLIV